jgi:hypothetical protein
VCRSFSLWLQGNATLSTYANSSPENFNIVLQQFLAQPQNMRFSGDIVFNPVGTPPLIRIFKITGFYAADILESSTKQVAAMKSVEDDVALLLKQELERGTVGGGPFPNHDHSGSVEDSGLGAFAYAFRFSFWIQYGKSVSVSE